MAHEAYLTKEKYDELKKELDFLKTTRRKEIAENLEYAKSLGDLSENAEYQEAREMQAGIEDRIGKLEAMLQSAAIVGERHAETVGVGSTVVVRKKSDKVEKRFSIVGSEEANTAEGKISNRSPLGEALLGKKKGDSFNVSTPKGKIEYEIMAIE